MNPVKAKPTTKPILKVLRSLLENKETDLFILPIYFYLF